MTVRCRHERGDEGPSSSVTFVTGISMLVGLRVSAPVDTDDAAILSVRVVESGGNCPAVVASVARTMTGLCTGDSGRDCLPVTTKVRVNVTKKYKR